MHYGSDWLPVYLLIQRTVVQRAVVWFSAHLLIQASTLLKASLSCTTGCAQNWSYPLCRIGLCDAAPALQLAAPTLQLAAPTLHLCPSMHSVRICHLVVCGGARARQHAWPERSSPALHESSYDTVCRRRRRQATSRIVLAGCMHARISSSTRTNEASKPLDRC